MVSLCYCPTSPGTSSFFLCLVCSRQVFSVALEPVLELALLDQACLDLTEICLPQASECWD